MDQAYSFIMLAIVIAIFYFMLIRPESKRKKAAEQMRNSLKKGDVITTIGGIIGKIVAVTDETIVIETSEDRVRMELTKWSVSTTGVQGATESGRNKKKKAEETPEKEEQPSAEELPEEPVDEIPAPEEEKQD